MCFTWFPLYYRPANVEQNVDHIKPTVFAQILVHWSCNALASCKNVANDWMVPTLAMSLFTKAWWHNSMYAHFRHCVATEPNGQSNCILDQCFLVVWCKKQVFCDYGICKRRPCFVLWYLAGYLVVRYQSQTIWFLKSVHCRMASNLVICITVHMLRSMDFTE